MNLQPIFPTKYNRTNRYVEFMVGIILLINFSLNERTEMSRSNIDVITVPIRKREIM
jgi:hypothetical protein